MNFPEINRTAAQRQLELLGYQKTDRVYLRFFYPSDDPRKDTDKGRKSNCLNPNEIEAYQLQGRGAYFVVNGGGHKNSDVSVGRAIFIEHDDLEKEIQRELWKTLELPEPTFQVDTGGKSIHSYWVFERPIEISKWCELQRDLLEFTDADRSIKNPARVMRLAGAWHISFDESGKPVYRQSQIISQSGKVYQSEQLRDAIPCSTIADSPKNSRAIKHPESIQIPVDASVPLECCLAKESRRVLECGEGAGYRNTVGAKLARDLIGTYNYLLSIGQNVDGDPRQLLENYAERCTPPIKGKEVDSIWRSASLSQPTPSCGSEGVDNCIKGWYWRAVLSTKKNTASAPKEDKVATFSKKTLKPKTLFGESDFYLSSQIDSILERHLDESQQDIALVELAKSLDNYNASEIRAIAAKRIEERHRQDNLDERRSDLERLESWESEEYLPFDDLFYDHPQVANVFKHLCRINPKIQPQYFLGFLSTFSSLVGIKGAVKVPVLGSLRSTLNLALVGESGAGKSIVSGILLKPLYRLQKELHNAHNQQKEQFRSALEQWEQQHPDSRGPKPQEKDFVTISDAFLVINEYSREGIVKNHADNPNGLLIHQEELVAIQRAQNMYRQGKGDDRQFLNNLYDNSTITRALRSERIIVDETAVSIIGGYQPSVVLSEMGDLSDPDGQWARFNFINGNEKRVFTDLNQPSVDLSDFFYNLYRKALYTPEVTCRLDGDGIELLQKFVNEMEDLQWRTLQGGLRAVYSKASSEVCRIALGLHWANSLIGGDTVSEIIPARAIEKAIKIKRYFLQQIKIIRTWGEANPKQELGMAPMYREIQKIARRLKGSSQLLTVRMVQQARLPLFKGLNSEGIKKIFQDMAAMGKAKLTQWKRGIALLIDSMNPGDGSNGERPPNFPNNNGNFPGLLKTVGDLLEKVEKPGASNDNGFKSCLTSVETVETVGRCLAETCREPVDLPTLTTMPTVTQTITPKGFESVEPLSTNFQQFQEEKTTQTPKQSDVDWLVRFLADLEKESAPYPRWKDNSELENTLEEAEAIALTCKTELERVCPDYWERVSKALLEIFERLAPISSEPVASSQSQQSAENSQPTLAEMQALLLACKSLNELKALKKKHRSCVSSAYKAMPIEQQLIVDGISAATVDAKVFKYTGKELVESGQRLVTGALVYLDPKSASRPKSGSASVWLLKGLKCGWNKAVEVSRDCLLAVEKAIAPVTDVIDGEQGMLFEP
jgi:hypothetical protein